MSRRSTRTGRHILVVLGAAVALVLGTLWGSPAGAAGRGSAKAPAPLDVYSASLTAKQAGELARSGHDMSSAKSTADGVTADLVLTAQEASALRDRGMSVKLKRVKGGKTVRQLAAAAGGRRLQRLPVVGRAGRHPRRAVRASPSRTRSWSSSWCSATPRRVAS